VALFERHAVYTGGLPVNDLASLQKMREKFLRLRTKLEDPSITDAEDTETVEMMNALLFQAQIPDDKIKRVRDCLMIGHRAELVHDILHGTRLWNESMRPA
jgi:hypothetical protein